MSSTMPAPYGPGASHHSSTQAAPAAAAAAAAQTPGQPAGIFASGTKVQVGGSRVVVERYLSEGGFAHVYLVKLPKPIGGESIAVLKRVAVPDKEALAIMRSEVETMKKLRGHRHIVTYFDSHASQLQGSGYEVFVLMEYCSGGGLIDFMNTRLQNRLTEPEILKIFSDTAQGVATMHYLKPPLLHRDLKVENILISNVDGAKQFKLCDFGSAAPPRPAAQSAAEGRLIEDDVQRHTTMQYRSPEMIDVYRKHPIDEKSDIWALGVFLYKLCYYTTPFEEQGQMAILNASFRYPAYPSFSDRLKRLIAIQLQEQPSKRPNIYQVMREVCSMRGTEVPIKDIYSGRTASEARRNQELPPPPGEANTPPIIGAVKVTPVKEEIKLPDITPMRRGRPTKSTDQKAAPKPSPSPLRIINSSDPFSALDSNGKPAGESDELASRFPTLDQFSILHDSGSNFTFDKRKSQPVQPPVPKELSQRVTEALADDAFASPSLQPKEAPSRSKPSSTVPSGRKTTGTQTSFDLAKQQQEQRAAMVSTGTMTGPSVSSVETFSNPSPSLRQNFRVQSTSDAHRASSQPRSTSAAAAPSTGHQSSSSATKDGLLARPAAQTHRSHSQSNLQSGMSMPKRSPNLRPSMDSGRPNLADLEARPRSRPVSGTFESAAKFFQGRGSPRVKPRSTIAEPSSADLNASSFDSSSSAVVDEGGNTPRIGSDVDFLRAMEGEENAKSRREKRRSTGGSASGGEGRSKRSSMPSISLSGTKNLLAGRFGEAFRRFEASQDETAPVNVRAEDEEAATGLTPIAGSEATDGRSDDGLPSGLDETQDVPPEVRRELERRRLSAEEKRVADAAAAYKARLAEGNKSNTTGGSGPSGGRAMAIQNKVQALLDESTKVSETRTAEGYGRFTAEPKPQQLQQQLSPSSSASTPAPLPQTRQAAPPKPAATQPLAHHATLPARTASLPTRAPTKPVTAAVPSSASRPAPGPKPKPQALRTGNTGGPGPAVAAKPPGLAKAQTAGSGMRGKGADGLGVAAAPQTGVADAAPPLDEDWEANFSKKYPSLAGLEMVETEIDARGSGYRDI